LLPEVVPMVAKRDCIVADRNFCTLGFLFGIARQGAFCVIRPPGSKRSLKKLAKGEWCSKVEAK
jgi:hypothetical protein